MGSCDINLCAPLIGNVRLVDGGAPSQGRVEIYVNGSWSTLCGYWFGYNAARVVCRQLGLPAPFQVYSYGIPFGPGNGSVLTQRYSCQGNESSVLNCTKDGVNYGCYPRDIGISCGPLVLAGA